jgi:putative transposase
MRVEDARNRAFGGLQGNQMVNYRRNFLPGRIFFTVTLADRRSSILVNNIVSLRHAFRITKAEQPFVIDAIVVLPEHLHAVMTLPSEDSDFSGRWRRIKSLFSRDLVARKRPLIRNDRGEYSLWQRRFWEHTVRDENDFARHVDYIHYNPVKHGLVSQVRDWPYSSFHVYVRRGVLPQDWAGIAGDGRGNFGERRAP